MKLVNYRYDRSARKLLFSYLNTFCQRAIGLKFGRAFIGVMISDPDPLKVDDVDWAG